MADLPRCRIFGLFALFGLFLNTYGDGFLSERELRRAIFHDYDKNVRPVKRASTAVPLKVDISLLKLKKMDEKEKIIEIDTLMKMKWVDEYLQWDPTDYDNITQLRIPPVEVWRPDFALYSALSETTYFPTVQTNVIISSNGTIAWVPPFTMKSSCHQPNNSDININFVECDMYLGSWTHNENLLNIQLEEETVRMHEFYDINPDWKISKAIISRESKFYPCCTDLYSLVHLNITLERRNPMVSSVDLNLHK